jgi:hypothetical protein
VLTNYTIAPQVEGDYKVHLNHWQAGLTRSLPTFKDPPTASKVLSVCAHVAEEVVRNFGEKVRISVKQVR